MAPKITEGTCFIYQIWLLMYHNTVQQIFRGVKPLQFWQLSPQPQFFSHELATCIMMYIKPFCKLCLCQSVIWVCMHTTANVALWITISFLTTKIFPLKRDLLCTVICSTTNSLSKKLSCNKYTVFTVTAKSVAKELAMN